MYVYNMFYIIMLTDHIVDSFMMDTYLKNKLEFLYPRSSINQTNHDKACSWENT